MDVIRGVLSDIKRVHPEWVGGAVLSFSLSLFLSSFCFLSFVHSFFHSIILPFFRPFVLSFFHSFILSFFRSFFIEPRGKCVIAMCPSYRNCLRYNPPYQRPAHGPIGRESEPISVGNSYRMGTFILSIH